MRVANTNVAKRGLAGVWPTARIGDLKVAEYNPRTMELHELEKLKRSIREFGFVEPIVVRASDGLIIGGHQRLAAFRSLLEDDGLSAKKIATTEVPVSRVELDDVKARLLNLALNRIVGGWDYSKLSALFEDIGHEWSDDLHGLTGFEARELDDIVSFAMDASEIDDRSEKSRVGEGRLATSAITSVVCPHCGGEVRVGVA